MKINYKTISLESKVFHPFYGEGYILQIGNGHSVDVVFKDPLGNEFARKFKYNLIDYTKDNSIDELFTDKVKVITEAPEGSHKEVTYPVAVIKASKNIDASKAFLDFLSTDEAKTIFEKYGFAMK